MKKILYLHGLDSCPNEDRLKAIVKEYDTPFVVSPYIDYRKNTDCVFDELLKLAQDIKPDLIIGSSMGGKVGYYIAKILGCDVILFNPAICETSIPVKVNNTGSKKIKGITVLGILDDVIDSSKTSHFMAENEQSITVHKVLIGHRIPLNVFVEYIAQQ